MTTQTGKERLKAGYGREAAPVSASRDETAFSAASLDVQHKIPIHGAWFLPQKEGCLLG